MSCSRCKGEGHNKATCKQPAQPSEHTTTPSPALALDVPALALDDPALALDVPALALDDPALALDDPALALDDQALALDAPAPTPGGRDPTLIAEPLEHEEPTLIEPCPGSPSSAKVP
jgi:zinc finger SWIM domain-containing protein 3